MAKLAEFCQAPGDAGYRWWRAGAWAGKSALMAWFVLHPPEGVRVVSFFITARLDAGRHPAVLVQPVHHEREPLVALTREMPGRHAKDFILDALQTTHWHRTLPDIARIEPEVDGQA